MANLNTRSGRPAWLLPSPRLLGRTWDGPRRLFRTREIGDDQKGSLGHDAWDFILVIALLQVIGQTTTSVFTEGACWDYPLAYIRCMHGGLGE